MDKSLSVWRVARSDFKGGDQYAVVAALAVSDMLAASALHTLAHLAAKVRGAVLHGADGELLGAQQRCWRVATCRHHGALV